MTILLIIAFLIVVLLFSLSSISQSYASAKQAQAAIEASRAVQVASASNLVIHRPRDRSRGRCGGLAHLGVLPQVAEDNTPRLMDAAGECLL
jgi:hypothetical protein